jgi:ADP-ribose pyrophosphatase YjhB (NUDIX family)
MSTKPNFDMRIPDGDNRLRQVCGDCGFIHYENPRIIVGTLSTFGDKILLCRRAIEPRAGYWTLPAGFLEMGESTRAGAERETLEEAGVRVRAEAMLSIYDLPHIGQVHIFYLAQLADEKLDPGEESLEAAHFAVADLPWEELAFPTIHWALEHFLELGTVREGFAPFFTPKSQLDRWLAD